MRRFSESASISLVWRFPLIFRTWFLRQQMKVFKKLWKFFVYGLRNFKKISYLCDSCCFSLYVCKIVSYSESNLSLWNFVCLFVAANHHIRFLYRYSKEFLFTCIIVLVCITFSAISLFSMFSLQFDETFYTQERSCKRGRNNQYENWLIHFIMNSKKCVLMFSFMKNWVFGLPNVSLLE